MQTELPLNNDIDYTIVICTYNPDDRLLKRCLQAIYNLDTDGIGTEVILVDNSSSVPVDSLSYVREYLRKLPTMKMLMVAARGVNYARIAALAEAKGKYIIYFDHDNEPERNYLQELKKLNTKYPEVAAIGPGDVTIDFIDGIEKDIEEYARDAFREGHEASIKFSSVRDWQPCYPFGTGLCTYTFLLKEYNHLMRQGRLTVPEKADKELTIGEDMQMVLLCISKGYFAGVSPTLQIKHIIPGKRANDKYLLRLTYSTAICYESSLTQVFPIHGDKLKNEVISESKFSRQTLNKFLKARVSSDRHKVFDLVQFIASNMGIYLALRKPVPVLIKRIIKYLKLE
ncbi:MAG: glycosyltransferase [Ginsengibacter sp.]